MKAALLIIDMQKAYYPGVKAQMDGAAEYINGALELFRARSLPILWIQNVDEEDGAVPGKPGFDLIDSLSPKDAEFRIQKTYSNSFNKTELAKILADQGVDTVVVSGFAAEFCVLSTYRGAQDLDLQPILYRGGIAAVDPANLPVIERINDIASHGVLRKLVGG